MDRSPPPPITRVRHLASLEITRQWLETVLTRLVNVAATLLTAVLTARSLGPDGRGALATATTVLGLGALVCTLGLGEANVYFAARDRQRLPYLLGNTLLVGVAAGGVLSLSLHAVRLLWPQLLPLPGLIFVVIALSIPLQATLVTTQCLLLGLKQIRTYNGFDLSGRILVLVAVLTLYLTGTATVGKILGASFLLMMPLLALTVWTVRRQSSSPPSLSLSGLRTSLDYGYKTWFGNLTTYVITCFDLVLVERIRGPREAGWYSVANATATLIVLASHSLVTVLTPSLAALPTFEERWRVARKATWLLAGCATLMGLITAMVASPLFEVLFGAQFLPAVEPLLLLLPGLVCLSALGGVSSALTASEHTPLSLLPNLLSVTLSVGGNLWLIPRYGMLGAAAWSSVIYTAMLALNCAYLAYYRRYQAATLDLRRTAS